MFGETSLCHPTFSFYCSDIINSEHHLPVGLSMAEKLFPNISITFEQKSFRDHPNTIITHQQPQNSSQLNPHTSVFGQPTCSPNGARVH